MKVCFINAELHVSQRYWLSKWSEMY